MYSLDNDYYLKTFDTLDELIQNIIKDGVDPNYGILLNGHYTGADAIDYINS